MDAARDPTDDLPALIRQLRDAADQQRRLVAELRDELCIARAEAAAMVDPGSPSARRACAERRPPLPPPKPLRRPLNPPDAPPPTTGLPPL